MEYNELQREKGDIYRHSGFGIASFCLSIIAHLITWVTVISGVIFIPEDSNSELGGLLIAKNRN